MNISTQITDFAAALNLDTIATGGGCDYVCRNLSGGAQLTLGGTEDPESPERLDEPALVNLYSDESWQDCVISLRFPTAKSAMEAMAGACDGACAAPIPADPHAFAFAITTAECALRAACVDLWAACVGDPETATAEDERALRDYPATAAALDIADQIRALADRAEQQAQGIVDAARIPGPQEVADSILDEIAGHPNLAACTSFSELHDHCDANCLGMCEGLLDVCPEPLAISIIGQAQDIVDAALPIAPKVGSGGDSDDDTIDLGDGYSITYQAGSAILRSPGGTHGGRTLHGWTWEHPGVWMLESGPLIYAVDDDAGARIGAMRPDGAQVWLEGDAPGAVIAGLMVALSESYLLARASH